MEKMVFSCPECGGSVIQTVRNSSPAIFEFQDGQPIFGVKDDPVDVYSLFCNDCGFMIGKFVKRGNIRENLWGLLEENGWLRKVA